MKVEGAIKKANSELDKTPKMGKWVGWTYDAILLDPLFWQSLGKAMGWKEFNRKKMSIHGTWWSEWHRFIDHLADGKDEESFFSEITGRTSSLPEKFV